MTGGLDVIPVIMRSIMGLTTSPLMTRVTFVDCEDVLVNLSISDVLKIGITVMISYAKWFNLVMALMKYLRGLVPFHVQEPHSP